MTQIPLTESVRAWLRTCPLLEGDRIGIDFLPADAQSYTIEVEPTQPVLQQYLDGGSKRQFDFVLASRELHGDNLQQNTQNAQFYEAFTAWVEQADWMRNLPQLGENRKALRMQVLTGGYLFAQDNSGTARYQVQCKMVYYQKGNP